MISIYNSRETDFSHNGDVILSDCISAIITEETNGLLILDLEYPLDAREKWQYLVEDNVIKADRQLFRIYDKIKTLTSVKIIARHIFYDLLDNFLEDVRPTDLNCNNALNYILSNTQFPHNFTAMSDIANTSTKYFVRKNPVEAIMGQDGIIANWGGEIVRDNFEIKVLENRGMDRGVLIKYGKNIQGITETLDVSNICTRLLPLGKDGLMLSEKYIDSPYINNYPHPKIRTIEFSDCDDEVTLRTTATTYMIDNKIDIPQFNYSIDLVLLSSTVEYKKYAVLEQVFLCDLVTIKHSKLNIDLKAKIIKTTKNVITNRLEKIELGSFKPNSAKSLNSMSSVLSRITTTDGKVRASEVQGIIDATKASLQAMATSAETQVAKAILFEDRVEGSPTYGAMALGTKGFMIASELGDNDWIWSTFGTGKGFIADLIVAGQLIGGKVNFDLDAGTLRIGNSDTDYKMLFDGNNLKLVDTPIKISHSDGSYTLMDANGFQRFKGATGAEYHYLSYTGFALVTAGTNATVTLPSDYIGKDFKVFVSLKSVGAGSSAISIIKCEAVNINPSNGTFQIALSGNMVQYYLNKATAWDVTVGADVLTNATTFTEVNTTSFQAEIAYMVIA